MSKYSWWDNFCTYVLFTAIILWGACLAVAGYYGIRWLIEFVKANGVQFP